MFCSNCGTQLANGVNFCPNCGAQVKAVVQPTAAASVGQGNMLMVLSLGTCSRSVAAALFQQLCGYASDEALLIADSMPITVARGLNDAQAKYLAQAFAEYGLEVAIYDGNGWREWESNATSVWDNAGALITSVASALGLISVNNRIAREQMHRWDYPYRYTGARPPVYRLNTTLRSAPPRRVAPVRPPVHHAVPPVHTVAARPAPVRPAPPPVRPAPAPARPAPVRPAPAPVRPAPPQPARPAAPQPPARPTGPAPRPGNGNGRPGGAGRQGGGGRPGM